MMTKVYWKTCFQPKQEQRQITSKLSSSPHPTRKNLEKSSVNNILLLNQVFRQPTGGEERLIFNICERFYNTNKWQFYSDSERMGWSDGVSSHTQHPKTRQPKELRTTQAHLSVWFLFRLRCLRSHRPTPCTFRNAGMTFCLFSAFSSLNKKWMEGMKATTSAYRSGAGAAAHSKRKCFNTFCCCLYINIA